MFREGEILTSDNMRALRRSIVYQARVSILVDFSMFTLFLFEKSLTKKYNTIAIVMIATKICVILHHTINSTNKIIEMDLRWTYRIAIWSITIVVTGLNQFNAIPTIYYNGKAFLAILDV